MYEIRYKINKVSGNHHVTSHVYLLLTLLTNKNCINVIESSRHVTNKSHVYMCQIPIRQTCHEEEYLCIYILSTTYV